MALPYYSVGTATLTQGSVAMVGQGTLWAGNIRPGDRVVSYSGQTAIVGSVNSDTSITLTRAFRGTSQTAQAYEIAYAPADAGVAIDVVAVLNAIRSSAMVGLSGVAPAARKLPYFDAASAAALADFPDASRTQIAAGLGDAAKGTVQSSLTDTTAGRLMQVGAFGLGATANMPVAVDCNTMLATGMYSHTPSSLNGPAAASGALEVFASFGRIIQRATFSPDAAYIRRSNDNGVTWEAWRQSGPPVSGSNANGRYVRFADGTLFCTRSVSVASGSASSVTDYAFPASFSGGPSYADININTELGGANIAALSSLNQTKSVQTTGGNWRTRFVGYDNTNIGNVPFVLFALGVAA